MKAQFFHTTHPSKKLADKFLGPYEETSWILATELGNAPELVTDYHVAYLAKPGPLHRI